VSNENHPFRKAILVAFALGETGRRDDFSFPQALRMFSCVLETIIPTVGIMDMVT
jgi:hypothetical protein